MARFWYVQKAIRYPHTALYDASTSVGDRHMLCVHSRQLMARLTFTCPQNLRTGAARAFDRIFHILARSSNVLHPAQIQKLQRDVFQSDMSRSDTLRLFSLPASPAPNSGDTERGVGAISLAQFHGMMLRLLQQGSTESVWRILRRYGYDTHLELAEGYAAPKLDVAASDALDFSEEGWQFLGALWTDFADVSRRPLELRETGLGLSGAYAAHRMSQDSDVISPEQLGKLFSITPGLLFSPNQGGVTQQAWLGRWA